MLEGRGRGTDDGVGVGGVMDVHINGYHRRGDHRRFTGMPNGVCREETDPAGRLELRGACLAVVQRTLVDACVTGGFRLDGRRARVRGELGHHGLAEEGSMSVL